MVGIDVEWKPDFRGEPVIAAIIQIATKQKIFIIDVKSLREVEKISPRQGRILIEMLFANPNIRKLGFGIREDLNVLARSLPGMENLSKSLCQMMDLHNVWVNIQSKYPHFFPHKGTLFVFPYLIESFVVRI